ncbi:MAG: hypothetical protein ACKOOC_08250, partial [Cyanobium sp.]
LQAETSHARMAPPPFLVSMSATGMPEVPWPPESLALAGCLPAIEAPAARVALSLPPACSTTCRPCWPLRGVRRPPAHQGINPPAARSAAALVEHALGWLRADISDPGCPSHGH